MAPDLPVHVLVRAQSAAGPAPLHGEPGTCDPGRQPPRRQGAQRPDRGRGQDFVPCVRASRSDAREQNHRLHPFRGQARGRHSDSASERMSDQHGAIDAPRVQVIDDGAGIGRETARRKLTGAVSRPIWRDYVEPRRQPFGDLMPVGR
jgi:hypothetical protein